MAKKARPEPKPIRYGIIPAAWTEFGLLFVIGTSVACGALFLRLINWLF